MQSWWEVVTPSKEIREGNIREDIFAADLGDVVDGKAPLEYTDAVTFFSRTYLTQGLKNLLEDVLSILAGNGGNPVIQLKTPFGGGKTHALLALYHWIKNGDKIDYLYPNLPKTSAKVVVFVGTKQDPLKGRTPWGEMAYQLGRYDFVKEHDDKRISPGKDVLSKVLGDEPLLILIDELVEYAVKAKDFADQVSAFSQELTEVVRARGRCCLVCTLPSSAPYGERGERALNELQKIFGRVETIYEPVKGMELYEIIRKRLFDYVGDESTIKNVAQSHFEMYQKMGADVPPKVKEVAYRDKIEHAYPFHPELIDLLYERWGSYSTFQRTRGVMALLAWVVHDLYKQRLPSPLIYPSLVNLENTKIRSNFIKHIGSEYNSVIDSDIAGRSAKSQRIDKEMGSEYEKYGIAKNIATTIFLYSFTSSGKSGITLPEIRVAILREGIPPTIVGDAVNKLKDELWYLHTDGVYRFTTQPNLNRVIVEREQTITSEKTVEETRKAIQNGAGSDLQCYLWPKSHADIPDDQNLKLAILPPEFDKENLEFFDKAGSGFRANRNTLFLIGMDSHESLSMAIKNWLALKSIEKDPDLSQSLAPQDKKDLKERIEAAKSNINFEVISAYRHLALPEKVWKDLGTPTIGLSSSISERVKNYLLQEGRILREISPQYIFNKAFGEGEGEKRVENIYNLFLRTPGLSIPENKEIFLDAIKTGVKGKKFGLEDGSIYFGEDCSPTMESIVLRPEIAEQKKEKKREDQDIERPLVLDREIPQPPAPPERGEVTGKQVKRKKLAIRAKVPLPWNFWSNIFRGVIQPLQGDQLRITIEVEAEGEIDENTINLKIKETLNQIGAEVERFNVVDVDEG
ncbi:ATP-binding protein [Candidatus Methanoliparum sp. LAM-1]|uniref:ATP-binding protein n=1 Tax=Candidatus Methanoliparum sp. LAM-1 TaxID=2874846 RepID=UPI001E3F4E73|nr:DUF499 domain-containing protein [Candidatus Methanoliparum sp. LAM-1]BDC35967.1 hypothetical protein MTLP_06490 [Candidatus Methanoliparum sp. LAM-1]